MTKPGAVRTREWRARQREGLQPASERRPPELADAVETTLASLALPPGSEGVAQLARRLAEAIDQARDPHSALRWLGPELQRVLEALEATPVSRTTRRETVRTQQ